MKSKNTFAFIGLFVSISLLISGYSKNKPVKGSEGDHLFSIGWKFIRDSIPGAEQPGFDDSKWMVVDLPHDYSIIDLPGEDGPDQVGPFSRKSPGNGNSTGHVIGGTGWYRKSFVLDKANEGKPLQVRVFTKASHVRLELNGKTIGEKELSAGDKYIAVFEVPYQPGELKALALENGKEIASKVLKTAGEASAIRLTADRNRIKANRNDLAFVKIEVIDANGQLVPQDSIPIKLILSGNGELAASTSAGRRPCED
jgi:hypothetical protein